MGNLRASAFDTVAFDGRLAEDRLIEMGILPAQARAMVREMEQATKREQLLADLRAGKVVKLGGSHV